MSVNPSVVGDLLLLSTNRPQEASDDCEQDFFESDVVDGCENSLTIHGSSAASTSTFCVVADNNTVGQIPIMEFDNLQSLRPEGNGLYSADGGRPATETSMKQGMIEGSNVNAVMEMTRMIEILRDYQSTMKMISSEDERQRGAIQKLANANA